MMGFFDRFKKKNQVTEPIAKEEEAEPAQITTDDSGGFEDLQPKD